jgi:hypothetical protein
MMVFRQVCSEQASRLVSSRRGTCDIKLPRLLIILVVTVPSSFKAHNFLLRFMNMRFKYRKELYLFTLRVSPLTCTQDTQLS